MDNHAQKNVTPMPEWYKDTHKILNTIRNGFILTDGNGIVLFGNLYYSLLSGFDVRKYLGRHVNEISANEQVLIPEGVTMFDRVKVTKKDINASIIYNTDDLTVTSALPILDQDNELKYVVYTIINYSDTARMRSELEKSTAKAEALENELRRQQVANLPAYNIVVRSREMRNLFASAARIAPFPVSVLILGESGVGKDVLARYIHASGNRANERFVSVNVGAIPHSLFESELFGYAPGAFTGAAKSGKLGLIQLADKGTLFLDEIGELPPELQVKLLQVLQNKIIRRIGSETEEPVDIRIIAATNQNLEQLVQEGKFRLDLYYRLNVVEFQIPPLRQRKEDIGMLAMYFLQEFNQDFKTEKHFPRETIELFKEYSWPGNVRELRHVVESMVVVSADTILTPACVPSEIRREVKTSPAAVSADEEKLTLKEAAATLERRMIISALRLYHTNAAAAEVLGISPAALIRKRQKYHL